MEQNTLCFNFNNCDRLHVVMIDGEPWFLVRDIVRALDIVNASDITRKILLPEEHRKIIFPIDLIYRGEEKVVNRLVLFVSESGLYTLIMRSRKPGALKFRHWVTSEVLPSLRKTGRYEMPQREPEKLLEPRAEKVELFTSGLQATLTLSGNFQEVADMLKRLQ